MSYLGLTLAFRNDSNTVSTYAQTNVTYGCDSVSGNVELSNSGNGFRVGRNTSFVIRAQQSETRYVIVWHAGDLRSCFRFSSIIFWECSLSLCTFTPLHLLCYSLASYDYYKEKGRYVSGFLEEQFLALAHFGAWFCQVPCLYVYEHLAKEASFFIFCR